MLMPVQLALGGGAMSLAEALPAPVAGAEYGEVFTRPWVVDLILDLVGYTVDRDLGAQVMVEPSCGTGAFLLPIVDRLIASAQRSGRGLASLGDAICAFDLLDANAAQARKAVGARLAEAGLDEETARRLATGWVTTGDFLLHPHRPASADYVVGNPPYIRLESIPRSTMDAYRRACPTMRGRSDVYVGFIERGLDLLKNGGGLSYICADRWMRNQYGGDLRGLITASYAVETVLSMHEVDAFEDEVSAYPAIVVLRNTRQASATVVEAGPAFQAGDARDLVAWIQGDGREPGGRATFEASRVDGWFAGRALWPSGTPERLALIAELEGRFAPLQDGRTGTRVGVGLATGCDDVFISDDCDLVETERMLPLLRPGDVSDGSVRWSGRYVVNPWENDRLVDLRRYPRLLEYLLDHEERLRARHVATRRPRQWYRTIDRVDAGLLERPRIVIPDMKARAHPVFDDGPHYPNHNLYYVVSSSWDPEVLGGLLLSDVANLFVGAYCVKMRGGCYRFQAQYLRQIRVPELASVSQVPARELRRAFADRDTDRATTAAAALYGIDPARLR